MRAPRWISVALATAIHDESIYEFGGLGGLKDSGLLESALDRPKNRMGYHPESDVFDLAASLCTGLARNHAFHDGNKRTALLCTRVFLYLNGQIFEPQQAEEVLTLVAVATGAVNEVSLAAWLKMNSVPR